MSLRRTGSAAMAAVAVGALVAGGIALSAPAGAAKNVKPRSSGYVYGNWTQPGSGFTTGSDDTMSQVYQLIGRSMFPDLDDTPGPIYAAGTFVASGATTINRVGQWDANTSSWVPLTGDANGIDNNASRSVLSGATVPGVYGMVLGGDDSLYAGGNFSGSGSTTLNNVGKWKGSSWVAMGHGLKRGASGYNIQDMVIGNDFIGMDDTNYADDTIYALGGMTGSCVDAACNSTAISAKGIMQYSQRDDTWLKVGTGAISQSGNPLADNQVFAGAYIDDTLYVGGDFSSISGVSARLVAQYDTRMGTWSPVGQGLAAAANSVYGMAVHPITKDLYVGGTFSNPFGGTAGSTPGIVKWDYSSQEWFAVGSGLTNGNIDDIAFSADGKTMWIGTWSAGSIISGTNANQVASLTSDQLIDPAATAVSGSWNYLKSAGVIGVTGPTTTPSINQQAVRAAYVMPDGSAMFGGNFHTAGPIGAGRVAIFTAGPEPSPYDPVFPAGVPTDVVATSGWNKVTVDWKAPTYTGSYPITNYLVQASPGGTVCITRLTDPKLNQCTYTNLTPGVQYTFRVQALNGAGWGDRSAPSNVASPQNLRITSNERVKLNFLLGGGSRVTVSGQASGFANGTRITPYLMWNNSGTWEEQRNSGLTAQGGRFSWERKFSKNNNGRTLSVKFVIAPNESNSVSMGPVR